MTRYADLMAEAMRDFRAAEARSPRRRSSRQIRGVFRTAHSDRCETCGAERWNRTRWCEAHYFRRYRARRGGKIKNKGATMGLTHSPARPCPVAAC